jgi:hypothetical protein
MPTLVAVEEQKFSEMRNGVCGEKWVGLRL